MRQSSGSGSQLRAQGDRDAPWYDSRASSGWQSSGFLDGNSEQLARALGWFSIGLGLAQLAATHSVANWIGISDDSDSQAVLRAVGVREIASGIGLLTQPKPAGWLKARVGGDVMDLALLGGALKSNNAQPERVTLAMAAVAGITVLDLLCTQELSSQQNGQQNGQQNDQRFNNQQVGNQQSGRSLGGMVSSVLPTREISVKKSLTVNRSPEELYQFWHNFENLPRFMSHLESVQVRGDRQSHWKAKAPAGTTVEWDAEIVDDRPNELIAWRSLENADVHNAGSVRFEPTTGDRGTKVTVELQYDPPGGVIGATLAKLFGEEPSQQVQDDLRMFKQVIETGEVVRSDGSLWGPTIKQRPAQPPQEKELLRK